MCEGAANKLLWGRLRTGHSHNYCDFTFSEAKTIFYPRNGVGPGCASPMQYYHALMDGLKRLPGGAPPRTALCPARPAAPCAAPRPGAEIMWQLANFDFDKFAATFMNLEDFTHMQGGRLWCYEYDPQLTDLYVRSI